MATVSEQLRQAREQKKLSVYEVAEATKIKTDHIRALEEGDFRAFPAPVYIRGFVKAYGAILHLDVPRLVGELDAELAKSKDFRDFRSLPESRRTILDVLSLLVAKVNWRLAIPIAVLVILFLASGWAFRAWRQSRARDPLQNLGPGLYQPRKANPGSTLPLPAAAPQPKR
jgi:cytoskeletal protein RodZ